MPTAPMTGRGAPPFSEGRGGAASPLDFRGMTRVASLPSFKSNNVMVRIGHGEFLHLGAILATASTTLDELMCEAMLSRDPSNDENTEDASNDMLTIELKGRNPDEWEIVYPFLEPGARPKVLPEQVHILRDWFVYLDLQDLLRELHDLFPESSPAEQASAFKVPFPSPKTKPHQQQSTFPASCHYSHYYSYSRHHHLHSSPPAHHHPGRYHSPYQPAPISAAGQRSQGGGVKGGHRQACPPPATQPQLYSQQYPYPYGLHQHPQQQALPLRPPTSPHRNNPFSPYTAAQQEDSTPEQTPFRPAGALRPSSPGAPVSQEKAQDGEDGSCLDIPPLAITYYPPPQPTSHPPSPLRPSLCFGTHNRATRRLHQSLTEPIGGTAAEDKEEESNNNLPTTLAERMHAAKHAPRAPTEAEKQKRKDRKNAMSRARAAKLREQLEEIQARSKSTWTAEEHELIRQHESKRQKKNETAKKRASARRAEMVRILDKPKEARTKAEVEFLGEMLQAKAKKNVCDRNRRLLRKTTNLMPSTPPGTPSPVHDDSPPLAVLGTQLPMSTGGQMFEAAEV